MHDLPQDDGIQSERTSNPIAKTLSEHREPVAIDYSLQIDDVLAFQDYHLARTTGAARSSLWWAWPVLCLLLGSLALGNILMDWRGAGFREIMILVFATIILVGYVFRRPLFRANLRRNFRHERILFLPHRITLTPEAVEYRVGPNTMRTLWEGVAKIGLTETHLFIYPTPDQGVIVPRRAFGSEQEFERFCKLAQQYFRVTR